MSLLIRGGRSFRNADTKKLAVLGTVGVPANYGGFETLAENLVRYHADSRLPIEFTVYCSSKSFPGKNPRYLSAGLRYIPLHANGPQSIPYDIISLFSAVRHRNDIILLLGVSGAVVLPLIRLVSKAKIITNIDGIEWRREKWKGLAKWFLRLSEKIAVRFSHEVIADNAAIADYVYSTYGADCHVIAYGGDHVLEASAQPLEDIDLPENFAVAVCRIEPENNLHLILDAFSRQSEYSLVIVGNWRSNAYGRELRDRYGSASHICLLDPIYDLGKLKTLRSQAAFYVHGHSAGGTNPSLVEAMHFGLPILAYDCDFNRATTEDRARYFADSDQLLSLMREADPAEMERIGKEMLEIARRRYTWEAVGKEYFDLM
ncbi:glycosyl transferase [Geothermobacter hydrogeniphilus]|uniref:Glycosyl transferase n=1 Tax=Geothermobacter hydrogeniphilus TaxID=1969733 RepID=A0A2K2HAF4_9BACT|nr:DUF1972 domain-containing protein [Geothermobacter hydrogeniphilus]PNU20298.1 glycosyl transferase [Geothermobacter hydrogeniphilus]